MTGQQRTALTAFQVERRHPILLAISSWIWRPRSWLPAHELDRFGALLSDLLIPAGGRERPHDGLELR